MTIVALKKLTLCGLISDKDAVLDSFQQLGVGHLIPLQTLKTTEQIVVENSVDALNALNYLQQCEIPRHQVRQAEKFDFQAIIEEVLELKDELIDFYERRDFLQQRIKEVELWGDFLFPNDLDGYHLWFYIVPKRLMKAVKQSDLIWQRVNHSNTEAYIVVISKEEPDLKSMPVPRSHLGDIRLSDLQQNLEHLELAIEDATAKRASLTRWISLIIANLTVFSQQAELDSAESYTQDDSDLFVLQAWVATADIEKINAFIYRYKLAGLFEQPDGIEQPPTLLENTDTFAGGEEVVKFYQMPNYYGWDPSIVVFFSFALFFAMILSDAGYAAVFSSILAVKWRKMGQSVKGVRFRMLLLVMLSASLLWGILAGSYFGVSPVENSWVDALRVFDMNDFDVMMKISIFVGVAHIALANMVKAYQLKQSSLRFSAVGWALVVMGGFVLWLSMGSEQQTLLEMIAYSLLGLAAVALLCFSSERVIKKPLDLLLRLLEGLKSLSSVTKIFGDVLSYMRLFALGLASASLAVTFNQLAVQVYESMEGIGLLLSLLILIVGHSLNIMLGIMSGVVHGLRLNFIEFYNWSVSDEGYPFKVFSKKERY